MPDEEQTKIRMAVADDNLRMLEDLVSALSLEFDVVATARDGRSALDQIRALQPSVAVLDLNMPELNGIEVSREIKREGLECGAVICSVDGDPGFIAAAQEADVVGYVLKQAMNRDVVIAVRSAACGEVFTSSGQKEYST